MREYLLPTMPQYSRQIKMTVKIMPAAKCASRMYAKSYVAQVSPRFATRGAPMRKPVTIITAMHTAIAQCQIRTGASHTYSGCVPAETSTS